MLLSFYNQGTTYLNLGQPIQLSEGITWVLGDCASGKTCFCRAVSNIFLSAAETTAIGSELYVYKFKENEFEMEFCYVREKAGKVIYGEVQIPKADFSYCCSQKVDVPIKLFDLAGEICRNADVEKLLKKYALASKEKTVVWIPENAINKEVLNTNQNDNCISMSKDIPDRMDAELVIWDDIDLSERDEVNNFLKKILKKNKQAIVTCKRAEWLQNEWGDPDDFYFIKHGEMKRASDWFDKKINSIKQLNNLYKKSAF